MRKPPSLVALTLAGVLSSALVAAPPSPRKPRTPVPATVTILPSGRTLRMRWLSASATRKPPSAVGATAMGATSRAAVAGPPSPPKPGVVPATVEMSPGAASAAGAQQASAAAVRSSNARIRRCAIVSRYVASIATGPPRLRRLAAPASAARCRRLRTRTPGKLGELAVEALGLLQVRGVTDAFVPRRLGGRTGREHMLGHRRQHDRVFPPLGNQQRHVE